MNNIIDARHIFAQVRHDLEMEKMNSARRVAGNPDFLLAFCETLATDRIQAQKISELAMAEIMKEINHDKG